MARRGRRSSAIKRARASPTPAWMKRPNTIIKSPPVMTIGSSVPSDTQSAYTLPVAPSNLQVTSITPDEVTAFVAEQFRSGHELPHRTTGGQHLDPDRHRCGRRRFDHPQRHVQSHRQQQFPDRSLCRGRLLGGSHHQCHRHGAGSSRLTWCSHRLGRRSDRLVLGRDGQCHGLLDCAASMARRGRRSSAVKQGTSFTDTGLDEATEYYYQVTASRLPSAVPYPRIPSRPTRCRLLPAICR